MKPKRILVSPLDWGLGHASRLIPIVKELLKQQAEITLGGTGKSLLLLSRTFPQLRSVEIPGFTPERPLTNNFDNFRSLLSFSSNIKKERDFLSSLAHEFDIVISDNRYGLHHRDLVSVIVTHQLSLPPHPLKAVAQQKLNRWLKNFNHIWVPDDPQKNLSGTLGRHAGKNVYHIGFLSALVNLDCEPVYDACLLLTGPEHSRRELLEQYTNELKKIKGCKIIINADVEKEINDVHGKLIYKTMLRGEELNQILNESIIIISRNGYSTLMDLQTLGTPALLIPTPGQPEQAYLAGLHKDHPSWEFITNPEDFDKAISKLNSKKNPPAYQDDGLLQTAVANLLQEL